MRKINDRSDVKKSVVFIILDAFRWDYIIKEDTPLLYKLSREGIYVEKLTSTTGFTQRSAIFCGAYPDKTKNFTMFCQKSGRASPFFFLKKWRMLLKLLQTIINYGMNLSENNQNIKVEEYIKCFLKKIVITIDFWIRYKFIYFRTKKYADHAPTAFIPLDILHLIGVTEDKKRIYEPRGMGLESIFDKIYKKNLKFEYLMFPKVVGEDDKVLNEAINKSNGESDIYLLQFSDSDSLCHKYGPESVVRHEVTKEIDRKLGVLQESFEKKGRDITWVIIGDHGMTRVRKIVNVKEIIKVEGKKEGLIHGRDYLLFLDSTFARLWALNKKAGTFIHKVFHESQLIKNGTIVNKDIANQYRVPLPSKLYGDIVWWAKPGVLIYPDYFHPIGKIVKGMHGYDSHYDDMKGFSIVYGKNIQYKKILQANLVDLCPTLCDLLGISYPSNNEGRSLINSF